jgi:hypothetical protein
MSTPKRHHWWPRLQIEYWTDVESRTYMISRDGTFSRLTKDNIAVERHLYTFNEADGARNTAIETWFSSDIEGPFAPILSELAQLKGLRRKAFKPDEQKARMVQAIGFEILPYLEYVEITAERREVIASYVAGLLVRNPNYLQKIARHHKSLDGALEGDELKNISLNNMLYVYRIYKEEILKADFLLSARAGEHEFLFSDGGITAREPWSTGAMPFDLHVPLTPELSLAVLPYVDRDPNILAVGRARNQAISYMNRVVLSAATRFVYSRGYPPVDFIKRYFGVPAPNVFGYRKVGDRLETRFDPHRDPNRR